MDCPVCGGEDVLHPHDVPTPVGGGRTVIDLVLRCPNRGREYDPNADSISLLDEPFTQHLAEGECLIIMEIGAEKLRYLTGKAWGFRWDGETKIIDLDDVYEWAPVGTTRAS